MRPGRRSRHRRVFPKGTDLSRWDPEDIEAVAAALNSRPRKTLEWKTPAEALNEHLSSSGHGVRQEELVEPVKVLVHAAVHAAEHGVAVLDGEKD